MFTQTNIRTIIGLSCLLLAFSCQKDTPPPDVDPQNCWLEEEPRGILQFSGATHRFCFEEHQLVFLTVDRWDDVIFPGSCAPIRTMYGVGVYEFTEDMLLVSGDFYDETFKVRTPDCQEGETFGFRYPLKWVNDDELILFPDGEIYEQIRLLRE